MSIPVRAIASALARSVFIAGLLLVQPAWAQMEHEPNDPCPSAQSFGMIPLPFELNGNLDSSARPDVDFYRVRAAPGTQLRIDLLGETLGDPYLGAFDANCLLLEANDDSGGSLNSRLDMTVPNNGLLIFGVTYCCDGGFQGGGSGTYRLSIQLSTSIASISGRLVDAETGQGIPSYPQDGSATLRLCGNADCSSAQEVAQTYTQDDGSFEFTQNYYGVPLDAGRYEVFATARPYESSTVGPFDVAAGEAYDVSDVALTPLPTIHSIRGRVVDAITGEPLDGAFYYNDVSLSLCSEYCNSVANTYIQEDGAFVFTSDYSGVPLIAGAYQVSVSADEYYSETTEIFDVEEGADYDLGDVAIRAQTVGFSNVVPCAVPRQGGTCEFSVEITNRLSNGLLGGQAWAVIDGESLGSVLGNTSFQLEHVAPLSLRPGDSKVVRFAFAVPRSVDNGAYVCVRVYAGEATPNAFFGTEGSADLFCITKGTLAFEVVPPGQTREMFDRIHGRGVFRK